MSEHGFASTADNVLEGKDLSGCTVFVTGAYSGLGRETSRALAAKIWGLRILTDEKSASDLDAPVLVVSQFTLHASTRKGRRPSWSRAAPGSVSEPLVQRFCDDLAELGADVHTGRFGAHMEVESVNDGPVSIWIDTDDWG